jgi:AcrR family transcriptional regulator
MKTGKSTRQHPSRVGRPAGAGTGNRDAILAGARKQFAQLGYRATTLRTIAAAADVTPAMVHYHFTNKSGLYLAVIESVAAPMLERLAKLREENGPGGIEAFMSMYMRTIAANPDIPALLMQDVLSPSGPMRAQFARKIAKRARALVGALLQTAQREGLVDPDIDTDLGTISLLSLALFPFLAANLVRDVFDKEWDNETLDQLIRHQQRIFMQGAAAYPEDQREDDA